MQTIRPLGRTTTTHPIIIAGAGLAGLTCAFELSARGLPVVLLESRHVLGGRTSSWVQDGMPVESGLHRVIGFYTHFPAMLRRAGIDVDDIVFWEDEIEIRTTSARTVIGAAPLYRPLDTFFAPLSLMRLLSPFDLATLLPFMAAGIAEYFTNPRGLDQISVADRARAYGVTENTIQRLLVPLSTGLYFLPPEQYSAYAFFGTLAPYLPQIYSVRVGAFRGGMTEVLCAPLAAAIARHGGTVYTNAPVNRLLVDRGRVVGVEAGGQRISASHVVIAASLAPAQELIRASLPDHPWFKDMLRLPSMPAVTVQAELDVPSMPVDHTTFGPGTSLASFAEQSRTTFRGLPGRISIILGSPEQYIEMSDDEIMQIVYRDADRLGLKVRGFVKGFRIVRLPGDFYSLSPGTDALRPPQRTPVPGLTLAGDYTQQQFLATMEGAVYSGELAASHVAGGAALVAA